MQTVSPYHVPSGAFETSIEIKKSRFIARLCPVQNREQALDHLEQCKQDYPDARHHCWAYQIGSPVSPSLVAMSDDGEPSGTAGKPILNVIQHKDIGDLMLIVTRYFGGIKLGAGGLVRAYSSAAQAAYEGASFSLQQITVELRALFDFKDEAQVRHLLEELDGKIVDRRYSQQVEYVLTIPQDSLNQFKERTSRLRNLELQE